MIEVQEIGRGFHRALLDLHLSLSILNVSATFCCSFYDMVNVTSRQRHIVCPIDIKIQFISLFISLGGYLLLRVVVVVEVLVVRWQWW